MLAFAAAVPRVMVSAPEPPSNVPILLTVPVLAPFASVRVFEPAMRSICVPFVKAVARVTASLPEPPVIVSVLATVAVLAKLPKVRVSLPAPRSMLAVAAAAPR